MGTNNVNTLRKRHVNEIQWSQLDEQHLKKKIILMVYMK